MLAQFEMFCEKIFEDGHLFTTGKSKIMNVLCM